MERRISLALLAALCTLFVISEASSLEPSVEIISVEIHEPEEPTAEALKGDKRHKMEEALRPFFQGRREPEPMDSFLGKLKGAVLSERVLKNINKHVDKLLSWRCRH
uniref:Venom peptide Ld15a n=1 Tax=Lethocerus distinctifemur TaxID=280095 RepID=A0A2K8JLN0_9HEMI|nr:venom peptide Ld15a [Lethocerus distinctifemur]